ncbi:uncharacterized protein LOC131854932 isoform X3 [Achroia grisella]|uniref:uncharacterized protein LOC131854932 isoform X3 n=1 Tax=Achroia grisella TaxID=688607 RepID=UPI0027D2BBD1|nr:uncharacterized protein LOC131854932 isoform X3 [Achroia grisella]
MQREHSEYLIDTGFAEAESLCGAADQQERERDQFEDQYFGLVAVARTLLANSRGPRGSMCVEEISGLHSARHDFRTKWQSSEGEEMKVGAMVIVKDKVQPPLLWLLGRITKLSGSDTTRVAEIRTKTGIITRAYNNICVLPIY